MGGAQSHQRQSRRYGYQDHPGSLPMTPEDMFSGYYMPPSYPASPHMSPLPPISPGPAERMNVDPYFQYHANYGPAPPALVYPDPAFSGAVPIHSDGMRRGISDPNLASYDPYGQYGVPPGGHPQAMQYPQEDAYGAGYRGHGYPPLPPQPPPMGTRWGSLPDLHKQNYLDLARGPPRERPFLKKLFGHNSVAQRKNILKKLDQKQVDPYTKTAQWLMLNDRVR